MEKAEEIDKSWNLSRFEVDYEPQIECFFGFGFAFSFEKDRMLFLWQWDSIQFKNLKSLSQSRMREWWKIHTEKLSFSWRLQDNGQAYDFQITVKLLEHLHCGVFSDGIHKQ